MAYTTTPSFYHQPAWRRTRRHIPEARNHGSNLHHADSWSAISAQSAALDTPQSMAETPDPPSGCCLVDIVCLGHVETRFSTAFCLKSGDTRLKHQTHT
jgi:hypothetical protein